MHVAILVPGIMGTSLILPAAANGGRDDVVWPPSAAEVAFGYEKIDKLQSPHLVTGQIIDAVACFGFYNTIREQLDTLGFTTGNAASRRVEFAYDWRLDNFETARRLAAVIGQQHEAGATRISLICHSMGGLIGRLLLESGTYSGEPWFPKITLLATLATPHLGAPLALGRIFGLDSSSGISKADFRTLAANRAYPSGYQLIPAPGEAAIWVSNSPDLEALDPYDPANATALGLDWELVGRAKALHDALTGVPPAGVRYFYFGGTGHKTVTRINVVRRAGQPINHGQSVMTHTDDAGDGTVPLYSALPARGQRQIVINQHATVFKGTPFRKVFFRLLGGDAGAALETSADDQPFLAGSLDSPVYSPGDRPELRITVQSKASADGLSAVGAIEGNLILERIDEKSSGAGARSQPLKYAGAEISALKLSLQTVVEPGLYRLQFQGTPEMPEPLAFAVVPE